MPDILSESREAINEIDREMARLFQRRMETVSRLAAYKESQGLPIYDPKREEQLIAANSQLITDDTLRGYYRSFLRHTLSVSKAYQQQKRHEGCVMLRLGENSCPIYPVKGGLKDAARYFDLNRRVLIVTDEGVPEEYAGLLAAQCQFPTVVRLPQGEGTKCFSSVQYLLHKMLENGFTRADCCIALGGGVMTDLTGLAAALYMRGIDCYYAPTTLLAQVDAAIGGKTAVNLSGLKNEAGLFSQPKAVLVDVSLLDTLSPRHMANGMAEAIKMALVLDRNAFARIENGAPVEDIIHDALLIKRRIVEADEKEQGLRQVLNFGHTLGHAIESASGRLHGECVAAGILPMCGGAIRPRVAAVLAKYGLRTEIPCDRESVLAALTHDKKSTGKTVTLVKCDEIGTFRLEQCPLEELEKLL